MSFMHPLLKKNQKTIKINYIWNFIIVKYYRTNKTEEKLLFVTLKKEI